MYLHYYILNELALGLLMTFGQFDVTVTLTCGTVAGTVGRHHTASRYACCEGSLTWHFLS